MRNYKSSLPGWPQTKLTKHVGLVSHVFSAFVACSTELTQKDLDHSLHDTIIFLSTEFRTASDERFKAWEQG